MIRRFLYEWGSHGPFLFSWVGYVDGKVLALSLSSANLIVNCSLRIKFSNLIARQRSCNLFLFIIDFLHLKRDDKFCSEVLIILTIVKLVNENMVPIIIWCLYVHFKLCNFTRFLASNSSNFIIFDHWIFLN